MEFRYDTLKFQDRGDVVGRFLNIFELTIPKKDLDRLGEWKVDNGGIIFNKKVNERRFTELIDKGFNNLHNKVTKKKTVYIHRGTNIPLTGSIEFGLLDRGTNVIEVRPISGCNIKCVYCSVSDDARNSEIVVEEEYLFEEFKKLVEFKECDTIEAHIGTQGEPTLYADLVKLIKDIRTLPQVKTVVIDSNGVTLTKPFINELAEAGLTRINLSLNAIDEEKAWEIAGMRTPAKKILNLCPYIAEKMDLVIAPVLTPGVNDDQLDKLIEFTKSLKTEKYKPKIFIQNFLNYKFGRNPGKQMPFEKFYEKLRKLEEKHEIVLICNKEIFNIAEAKTRPKVFRKGEVVDLEIKFPGRLPREQVCVSRGVCVSVMNCHKEKGKVRVKILRTKHNIYQAVPV